MKNFTEVDRKIQAGLNGHKPKQKKPSIKREIKPRAARREVRIKTIQLGGKVYLDVRRLEFGIPQRSGISLTKEEWDKVVPFLGSEEENYVELV